jgi:hypothetical protein
MQTIHKHTLAIDDVQILNLPRFSLPLSVQIQNGKPQLWALVNTDEPTAEYTVLCYGTGHEVALLPVGHEFLGTVQLPNVALVFHFFGFYSSFADER